MRQLFCFFNKVWQKSLNCWLVDGLNQAPSSKSLFNLLFYEVFFNNYNKRIFILKLEIYNKTEMKDKNFIEQKYFTFFWWVRIFNYALELFNTCLLAERVATESKCQQSRRKLFFRKCKKIIQRKITDSSRFFFLTHLLINRTCIIGLCKQPSGRVV